MNMILYFVQTKALEIFLTQQLDPISILQNLIVPLILKAEPYD
jgi:hypothetical protein